MNNVLSEKDDITTMIFDEIDTGVSGRAAGKIAAKLCKIAKRKQVICIMLADKAAPALDSVSLHQHAFEALLYYPAGVVCHAAE